jgi:hypothetical protein
MIEGALFLLLAHAVEASAPVEDAGAEPFVDAWLFADEGYRFRAAGAPSAGVAGVDHDARLLLDGGARAFDGRVGIEVSGAAFWDIDGEAGPGLSSVHDARGAVDVLVDTLALRMDDDGGALLRRASLGRFTVEEGWPVTLDGAAFALTPAQNAHAAWGVFASFGRTVHFFAAPIVLEQDVALGERWAASLGSDVVWRDGLKLQVDYRVLGEAARNAVTHSYGAALWRRVDDVVLVHLFGRGLDDELSHVGGRAHAAWAPSTPWAIGMDGEIVEQVATLGEIVEEQDVFFAVLGVSHPHVRARLDSYVARPLDIVDGAGTLHLGGSVRQRLAGQDAPFNRNAARLYASADVDDVIVDGLFASLIASYDCATAGDDVGVAALGGSAGYSGDLVRVRVGTSWDRVKYTYYRDVGELIDVRTVFAAAEWRPWRALRVKGAYTLELADRAIHTLQLGLAHDLDGAL